MDEKGTDYTKQVTEREWFKLMYEKEVGPPPSTSQEPTMVEVLRALKKQAEAKKVEAANYIRKVPLKDENKLSLDWKSGTRMKYCGCPVTKCICNVTKLLEDHRIPKGRRYPRSCITKTTDCLFGRPKKAHTFFEKISMAIKAELAVNRTFESRGIVDLRGPEYCMGGCRKFFVPDNSKGSAAVLDSSRSYGEPSVNEDNNYIVEMRIMKDEYEKLQEASERFGGMLTDSEIKSIVQNKPYANSMDMEVSCPPCNAKMQRPVVSIFNKHPPIPSISNFTNNTSSTQFNSKDTLSKSERLKEQKKKSREEKKNEKLSKMQAKINIRVEDKKQKDNLKTILRQEKLYEKMYKEEQRKQRKMASKARNDISKGSKKISNAHEKIKFDKLNQLTTTSSKELKNKSLSDSFKDDSHSHENSASHRNEDSDVEQWNERYEVIDFDSEHKLIVPIKIPSKTNKKPKTQMNSNKGQRKAEQFVIYSSESRKSNEKVNKNKYKSFKKSNSFEKLPKKFEKNQYESSDSLIRPCPCSSDISKSTSNEQFDAPVNRHSITKRKEKLHIDKENRSKKRNQLKIQSAGNQAQKKIRNELTISRSSIMNDKSKGKNINKFKMIDNRYKQEVVSKNGDIRWSSPCSPRTSVVAIHLSDIQLKQIDVAKGDGNIKNNQQERRFIPIIDSKKCKKPFYIICPNRSSSSLHSKKRMIKEQSHVTEQMHQKIQEDIKNNKNMDHSSPTPYSPNSQSNIKNGVQIQNNDLQKDVKNISQPYPYELSRPGKCTTIKIKPKIKNLKVQLKVQKCKLQDTKDNKLLHDNNVILTHNQIEQDKGPEKIKKISENILTHKIDEENKNLTTGRKPQENIQNDSLHEILKDSIEYDNRKSPVTLEKEKDASDGIIVLSPPSDKDKDNDPRQNLDLQNLNQNKNTKNTEDMNKIEQDQPTENASGLKARDSNKTIVEERGYIKKSMKPPRSLKSFDSISKKIKLKTKKIKESLSSHSEKLKKIQKTTKQPKIVKDKDTFENKKLKESSSSYSKKSKNKQKTNVQPKVDKEDKKSQTFHSDICLPCPGVDKISILKSNLKNIEDFYKRSSKLSEKRTNDNKNQNSSNKRSQNPSWLPCKPCPRTAYLSSSSINVAASRKTKKIEKGKKEETVFKYKQGNSFCPPCPSDDSKRGPCNPCVGETRKIRSIKEKRQSPLYISCPNNSNKAQIDSKKEFSETKKNKNIQQHNIFNMNDDNRISRDKDEKLNPYPVSRCSSYDDIFAPKVFQLKNDKRFEHVRNKTSQDNSKNEFAKQISSYSVIIEDAGPCVPETCRNRIEKQESKDSIFDSDADKAVTFSDETVKPESSKAATESGTYKLPFGYLFGNFLKKEQDDPKKEYCSCSDNEEPPNVGGLCSSYSAKGITSKLFDNASICYKNPFPQPEVPVQTVSKAPKKKKKSVKERLKRFLPQICKIQDTEVKDQISHPNVNKVHERKYNKNSNNASSVVMNFFNINPYRIDDSNESTIYSEKKIIRTARGVPDIIKQVEICNVNKRTINENVIKGTSRLTITDNKTETSSSSGSEVTEKQVSGDDTKPTLEPAVCQHKSLNKVNTYEIRSLINNSSFYLRLKALKTFCTKAKPELRINNSSDSTSSTKTSCEYINDSSKCEMYSIISELTDTTDSTVTVVPYDTPQQCCRRNSLFTLKTILFGKK